MHERSAGAKTDLQAVDRGGMRDTFNYITMNPKLFVCAAAAAVALCGCAYHSTPDLNSGPYAEYGFNCDLVLSPVAALSTDDAQAVMAIPSGFVVPTVFVHRPGGINYYEPMASGPANSPPPHGAVETTPPATAPTPPPQ